MHRWQAIIVASFALCACASPAGVIDEARRTLEEHDATIAAADAARRVAVAEAPAAIASNGADTPCSVTVPVDPSDPRLSVVDERQIADSPGPWRAAFEAARTDLLAEILLLDDPSADEARRIADEVAAAGSGWDVDFTLVVDSRTYPRFGEDGYHPGVIEADLVVWDYTAGRVVCGARIAATNTPDVLERTRADEASNAAFEADPVAVLEADLLASALATGVERLRALE